VKGVEKVKTYILCSTFFKSCAFYEIMWNTMEEPKRS